jgi:general nucleoside transport system permease protein
MERMISFAHLSTAQRKTAQRILFLNVAALLSLIFFALMQKENATVTYSFVLGDEWAFLKEWRVGSKSGSTGFSIAAIILSAASLLVYVKRQAAKTLIALASAALFMSFLNWASAGDFVPFTGLLQGGLILSVPLVFGALAGVVCERSGVINIAIEGQLLAGAFGAGVAASLTQNMWVGLFVAPLAGALISLILATFAIKYAIDQVILGFVINVLVIGLTTFATQRALTTNPETWNSAPIFSPIAIPFLSKIPLIGPIFFNHTIIIYSLYVMVVFIQISLFKSKWGLRMRSVGEMPVAAESVGIDVNKVRFRNVLIAGAIAGYGGAFFTVGSVGAFSREMTAGMGFIALAALIFGRWTPMGAVAAALVFGFADQLRSVLSISGTPIPSEFMMMVPYIATIIAVSGFVGRVRAPAADGIPYKRGGGSR